MFEFLLMLYKANEADIFLELTLFHAMLKCSSYFNPELFLECLNRDIFQLSYDLYHAEHYIFAGKNEYISCRMLERQRYIIST